MLHAGPELGFGTGLLVSQQTDSGVSGPDAVGDRSRIAESISPNPTKPRSNTGCKNASMAVPFFRGLWLVRPFFVFSNT